MVNNFINEFIKVANKFNELQNLSFDFGTGEMLSPSEIHTIDAVGNNYQTVTEISMNFGITKGAVSQVITKLNKKGYIKKERNKSYGKEILLSLTDKGEIAYQSHRKLHSVMDKEFIDLVKNSPNEYLKYFNDMMTQIEKYIEKYIEKGNKI